MSHLAEGTYRLSMDVVNPKPDRRVNQDRVTSWRGWAIWPKDLIIVADRSPDNGQTRVTARGAFLADSLLPWDIGYQQLTEALEPIAEAPSDFLRRVSGSSAGNVALEILDRLLTVDAVRDMYKEIQRAD